MRLKIINYLKQHPIILDTFGVIANFVFGFLSKLLKIKQKYMLFASYGGRKFDDSPKAIYDEICKRREFDNWTLVWAFVEPEKFNVPRGIKVKIDTLPFFKVLLTSHVWISNSGMSRGIKYKDERIIKVETWHGSVTKKSCGEENTMFLYKKDHKSKLKDISTIRCAQSQIDVDVLSRLFSASKDSFIKTGFPRNDELAKATLEDSKKARNKLGIPWDKKVILYMPTWRQYDLDCFNNVVCKPPINISYWKKELGKNFVFLVRAHYAVTSALTIKDDDFVKNVSDYPSINDLYLASDILITDYSSAMIDYSILEKPIFCFAYDYEKYIEKIGLYLDLQKELPNHFYKTEKELIVAILNIDWDFSKKISKFFKQKHATFVNGLASRKIVEEILTRLCSEEGNSN